jgi:hypothetical protein
MVSASAGVWVAAASCVTSHLEVLFGGRSGASVLLARIWWVLVFWTCCGLLAARPRVGVGGVGPGPLVPLVVACYLDEVSTQTLYLSRS